MKSLRIDWFVVIVAALIALGGCGGGCGGCGFQPIPGGFDPAKRNVNAGQIRVTQSGLAAVSANPGALLGAIGGGAMNGVLSFNIPASCGGSTPICCPGGVAKNPCGPLNIDLNKQAGDTPRLVLAPQQGQSQLDVTVRARLKTGSDIPVTVPVAGDCGVKVDTTAGSVPDVQVDLPIQFSQDANIKTTRVTVGTVNLSNLESSDVELTGSFACQIASLGLSFFIDTLKSQLTDQVKNAIQDQTCKQCPSGNVADCGSPFATACTNGTCMEGSSCMQELGLEGRASGVGLFGGFSPGTTGGIDVYEVAGGYATTNGNGVALGLLGGMEPAGAPRDMCGPPSTEPAVVPINPSAFFQGNVRPDNAAPFDVGIGLHKWQLAQFAYAGYQGGLLCLTVGHTTVSQLTTSTISLISRSLGNLVETSSPMAVGLRPQSAPVITLGKNTFMPDGMGGQTLVEPLLDIKFTAMDIDFFVDVDDQYIRAFTVVADVHLPLGLAVGGMGELTPVLGNPKDAFSNISVKNSDAVTESPEMLAATFPSILELALPQLSGGLGSIKLPKLGGLAISVTDITAVDNGDYLAIFGNLVQAMPRAVHTTLDIAQIAEPADEIMRDPARWTNATPPAVTLALGGDADHLEWQIKLDDGFWSTWTTNPRPTLAPRTFWLPGVHHIEVRARVQGKPETISESVSLDLPIGRAAKLAKQQQADFHGQAGAGGCACNTRGSASGAGLLAIVVALLLLPMRRLRRKMARLGTTIWLAALACLPGCSCSSKPCGDAQCMEGEITHSIGRFTSIAGDDQRVMVATYEQVSGDLVIVDATNPTGLNMKVVDGLPDGATATYDPSTWRGGVAEAGPNVGAWTSIVLANHKASVAYQDRDAGALKYAYEDGDHWSSYVVDPGQGAQAGAYAKMIIDGSGLPVIAYLAVGVDGPMGHKNTELRLVRAASADPRSGQWTTATIASAAGSCGGLCGAGTSCVADAMSVESCVTPTTDCSAACTGTDVCLMGGCVATVAKPEVADIPGGTGLYVSLVLLPDGRLAAAYYDHGKRALVLGVESAKGSNMFMETLLDGGVDGADRGMWASAVAGGDGTVHIAYQDALGDQLMYTTWSNGTAGTPAVVDDGLRMGDRTHPVGAAATIYLVSGAPTIAYQDGMLSDVVLASKAGTMWTHTPLATGPLLDGFFIAATTGHGAPVLAWDSIDPAQSPPHTLAVKSP